MKYTATVGSPEGVATLRGWALEQLQHAMKRTKKTQVELATILDLAQSQVSDIMCNRSSLKLERVFEKLTLLGVHVAITVEDKNSP